MTDMIFLFVTVQLLCFVSSRPSPQADHGHNSSALSSARSGGWLDAVATQIGIGVKANDPPGSAPRRQELQTDNAVPGAKRVKIRSGPYIVPNMRRFAFLTGEHGMLNNYADLRIDKPCEECTILKQWAGLEFPSGSIANIDNSLWLHHMVHFAAGPDRWDPVCYGRVSLPHIGIAVPPSGAERFFTSGNERSVFDYNPNWKDMDHGSGYHITQDDKFYYIVELMNMSMEDKLVYVTMTYDILDGKLPLGWEQVKSIWLDANSCGTSEVDPPQEKAKFTIASKPWTPNFSGRILGAMGHVHDGGITTDTRFQMGQSLCLQDTRYSETSHYKYTGGRMGDDIVAKDHISSMSPCVLGTTKLSSDQRWQIIGYYNFDKRQGNIDRGKQSSIMAISIVRVAVGPTLPPRPSTLSNWLKLV